MKITHILSRHPQCHRTTLTIGQIHEAIVFICCLLAPTLSFGAGTHLSKLETGTVVRASAPVNINNPLVPKIEIGEDETTLPSSRVRDAVVLITGCTGTLVASDLVLTAAHCGYNESEYADGEWHTLSQATNVQVGPARNAPLFATTASRVSLPPISTAGKWPINDMALLRLDTPVPATLATPRRIYLDRPAPLELYALGPAEVIYQVGYGGRRDRRIMTGSNYVDWLTNPTDPDMLRNIFEYDADDAAPGVGDQDTNIEGGDSGGPMLLNSGTGAIMGVLSHWSPTGIATFGPGGNGRPSIRNWLARWVPPQKPDLEIVSVAASDCTGSGGDPNVRVTIRNNGTVKARGWVDVFTGLASPPSIGTVSSLYRMSDWIPPEGTQAMSFAIDTGFDTGWVDALVDTTESLDESNETNNHEDAYVNLPDCSFN